MTSTTDTDEHPEVAEISELTEGLLSPVRAAALRRHLADCPLCADVEASLSEIRSLLGSLPGPPRMPAEIAGRIDAALAAEALLDATAPVERIEVADASDTRPTKAVSRETGPAADRVSRETESPSEAEAATGASADEAAQPSVDADAPELAGTAPSGTGSRAADRPAGRPRAATTGPGRRHPQRAGRRGHARRWPQVLLGTACAAAVIGVGGLFVQTSGSDDGDRQPAAGLGVSTRQKSPGTALSQAGLETEVQRLLDEQSGHPRRNEPTHEVTVRKSPDTTLRTEESQVPSCVQAGTGRSDAPLATRQETYQGTPAFLLVLPHPADSSRVDAFVIDAGCTTATPPAPGTILLTGTFARP
ncbi:anti-sigma factor family protein [Streptomyces palmae]|uniref:Zinc-finger domain-containing protein n=1 Tax=Streptomyces palmae TaxID=1701085 RepID=A0A4Z0HIS7_9ACTN|nr:hypothetical protein [Streptomyces palmae]TGB17483.1 hypothetical protein E4099_03450 [Streptomyces palmae]